MGDLITLSGQVSIDDQGEVFAPDDLVAQARQAYVHVAATLDKLGAGMEDIVDETFFVTDVGAAMENIEALWTVRAEAYGGDPKVSQTMLQVGGSSQLPVPGLIDRPRRAGRWHASRRVLGLVWAEQIGTSASARVRDISGW